MEEIYKILLYFWGNSDANVRHLQSVKNPATCRCILEIATCKNRNEAFDTAENESSNLPATIFFVHSSFLPAQTAVRLEVRGASESGGGGRDSRAVVRLNRQGREPTREPRAGFLRMCVNYASLLMVFPVRCTATLKSRSNHRNSSARRSEITAHFCIEYVTVCAATI